MASEARIAGRISRILTSRQKCEIRLKMHHKDPNADNWRRKIAEYDKSLSNFKRHGQESVPTGNRASVAIDVPKGTFSVKAFTPEG